MSGANLFSGFLTRSDANQVVQPQQMVEALVSCVATSLLIKAFVFAYAKIRFSHDLAHLLQNVVRLLKY